MWLRNCLLVVVKTVKAGGMPYGIDSLLQDPFTLPALNMVSVILSTYTEQYNRCNFCFNDQIQFKNLLKSFYPYFHPLCFFSQLCKV